MAKKKGGECASTMNVAQAMKNNKSNSAGKSKAAPKAKAPKFMGGSKRGK